MKPPTDNKGAPNPYARRTPWGRVQAAPFRLDGGPGAAPMSGEPPAPKAPPLRQPRGGALPGPGEGILGGSPLMPAKVEGPASPLVQPAEARATPVHTSKPVLTPRSAPGPAIILPATPAVPPADTPPPLAPSDIIERLAEIERPAALTGRRLLIGAVALGVITLIGVAAVVLSRRDAGLADATPEIAVAAPAAGADAASAVTTAPEIAGLPAPPIYRATLPPLTGAGMTTAQPASAPAPAPAAPAPAAGPVAAAPEPAPLPPAVEAPAPKPAPPPAPQRPAVDPDAPFVLRRGQD